MAQITGLMIGMIVFTILLELALHKMEHKLQEHPHYLKMLGKLYQVRSNSPFA